MSDIAQSKMNNNFAQLQNVKCTLVPRLLVPLLSVTSSEISFVHYDTERSPKVAQVPRAISIIVSEI